MTASRYGRPIIEVKNLNAWFSGARALKDVTLEF